MHQENALKKIVAFGMNTVSRKQIPQFGSLNNSGYQFDIFTNNQQGDSFKNLRLLGNINKCYLLKRRALPRFFQIISYVAREYNNLVHAQIYVGGRFSFVYLIISRLFGLKTLAVEWGDLINLNILPKMTKFSMKFCYRHADYVWYRELYMERLLKKMGANNLFFINNAVPQAPTINFCDKKKYTFLWVNRLIQHRHSDWFVDIISEGEFSKTYNALLGFQSGLNDTYINQKQKYVMSKKLSNLEVYPFIDPYNFYLNSKFFVLPANIVFCNNSLIEAMSCGVVPIVSDVEGAHLIVEDRVDGFVAKNTYDDFRNCMKRAMQLTSREYEAMSINAINKTKRKFGLEEWKSRVLRMYDVVGT
jgi:glycosyltransferase involved in cell wall biosynthesis